MTYKNHISNYIKIENEFISNDEKQLLLKIYMEEDLLTIKAQTTGPWPFTHHILPKVKYLMMLKLNRWLEPWEEVYHINRDWKDDNIENLKIIDTRSINIEVKYPYDPEKYYGKIRWSKAKKIYRVYLYLKKEYIKDKNLENEIRKSVHIYIAETEKLKRFLNDDEKVIFIDKDKTNYNKNNLKIVKGRYSDLPIGKAPYQNYYIGNTYEHVNKSIYIRLYGINKDIANTNISLSKYNYQIKLGRKLEDNERLVFRDGNHLNHDIDNLTHKTLEQAEYPFVDYWIGSIYRSNKSGRKIVCLLHKENHIFNKTMTVSRYKMCIKEKRILPREEEVDHKDGNPLNDSDDNLQILTKEEHDIKTTQDKIEIAPKIATCCDGCNNEFIKHLSVIRGKLSWGNEYNNVFCTDKCRWKYMREGNKIEHKKLIKYICTYTKKEIELAEDMRFLPSRFNPDVLPFYDRTAVLNWIRDNDSGSF